MAVKNANKVVINGEVVLDLTGDSVTADKLAKGYTAHDKSGAVITGTMDAGGGEPVQPKDVNFIDYDGTVLHSYTVAEAAALTALPPLPSHDGLICQGWNWSLADIKALGRAVTVGAMYITDDGKTRIYIHLEEGRTSPRIACSMNGTVIVDWGDGTTPDTLRGTSTRTVKWTPTHNYAAPGDYVIKLTVNGEMAFKRTLNADGQYVGSILCYSSDNLDSDDKNYVYANAIQKIEIGNNVSINDGDLYSCYSLSSITMPNSCVASYYSFHACCSLRSIVIPNNMTNIGIRTFDGCHALTSISIPNSIKTISNYAFNECYALSRITLPNGITSIGTFAFGTCRSMSSIVFPNSITSIDGFRLCYGVKYYDFTAATAVPTLGDTRAFSGIANDCEIRVPASLVDTWKAATNWARYADHIVGV